MQDTNYMKGVVSIIIPTYNRYDMLMNCIESCLNQTYKHTELIIINDGSTDERYYSSEIDERFAWRKIKVIHLPVNMKKKHNLKSAHGLTRQEGLKIATGEWIAFLDDDDFLLPEKLETQLLIMKRNNYSFTSTDMYCVNHKSISKDKLDIEVLGRYITCNSKMGEIERFDHMQILHSNLICNSTVIMHRTLVEKVGEFKGVPYEDLDYWLRALLITNCFYINKPLTYYTVKVKGKPHEKHYKIK